MSTPTSGDLLLVNRDGVNYQIDYDDMSTLQDTDLLLVNRAGTNYQIAAVDINLGPDGVILPTVDVLTPVNGAGLNDGDPYTPTSSAYVSTSPDDVYHRYDYTLTIQSGGTWDDVNLVFDGLTGTYATLSGAADVVTQVTYTNTTDQNLDGECTVYAYAVGGGTIEVFDENDALLRTYPLPATAGSTAVGIVRVDNKVRFTTTAVNTDLLLGHIIINSQTPTDYVVAGRQELTFTDDTDLDKMVGPIIQVDENGDVKVPTTSTVDSTTSIPGRDVFGESYRSGSSNAVSIFNGITEDRLYLTKAETGGHTYITDNVVWEPISRYTYLGDTSSPDLIGTGVTFNPDYVRVPAGTDFNVDNVRMYDTLISRAPLVMDIVTWTGDGTDRAISHNLGCKAGFIMARRVDNSGGFQVWHNKYQSKAKSMVGVKFDPSTPNTYTAFLCPPTSTHFYVSAAGGINSDNAQYVAYIFPEKSEGRVWAGEYTSQSGTNVVYTNGNAYDGPQSDTGGGFFMTKVDNTNQSWAASNYSTSLFLYKWWQPNSNSSATGSSTSYIDLGAGRIRFVGNISEWNSSANYTYKFLWISRDCLSVNSTQLNLLSGQDLEFFQQGDTITSNLTAGGTLPSYANISYSGNGSDNRSLFPRTHNNQWIETRPGFSGSFNDRKWMYWWFNTSHTLSPYIIDSERSIACTLKSDHSLAEDFSSYMKDTIFNGGFWTSSSTYSNNSGYAYAGYLFGNAPQFFDVQKYLGNGSTQVINHDLGVEPGAIIIKNTTSGNDFQVHHAELGFYARLILNSTTDATGSSANYFITATDADSFTLSSYTASNAANQVYIAYVFAKDTPYVKCGSYTGTGSGSQVDVGFQPRWMMIKRTDLSGEWTIFSHENDGGNQYLTNSNADAFTATWSFNATGIYFGQSIPDVNASGGNFVYIAIADGVDPPSFPSSSTVTTTPDPQTAVMTVDAESFDVGDTASGQPIEASITSVASVDGNVLTGDGITGTWMPGLYAQGSEITQEAPSPDEIVFTSSNQGTTPFSGIDATLSSRTWTLESGPSETGPWTLVDTYTDYDALDSQDGATPWTTTKPGLTPSTFYRVKVRYDSTNAESVESVYHTFKTSV